MINSYGFSIWSEEMSWNKSPWNALLVLWLVCEWYTLKDVFSTQIQKTIIKVNGQLLFQKL